MFRRLFTRLFFNYILVLLCVIAVFGVVIGNTLSFTQYRDSIRQMQEDARLIARNYSYLLDRQITAQVLEDAIEEGTKNSELWMIGSNGLAISITGFEENKAPSAVSAETQSYMRQVTENEEPLVLEGVYDGDFGQPIVTVVYPLSGWNGPVGALFLHRNLSYIRPPLHSLLMLMYPGIFIAVGVGLLLSYTMTMRISKPLTEMSTAAQSMTAGDMSVRLDDKGSIQEINEVAAAFNTMIESISSMEEMRRGFVANVSHELRSPITSIAGYLQGMLDGTIPESEHKRYMQVVYDETQRLSRLIHDLLDLSRIESGSVPLNQTDFDICELLNRVFIKFEGRLEEKSMDLDLHYLRSPLLVHADIDRIEQVVSNLVDNAIKFCGQYGKITVDVEEENGLCAVTVRDDGAGIRQEDLPHVFERFYKADKAHTSGLGTGLGLSIVQRILRQHGQDITVSSEEGRGAAFRFTLALAQSGETASEKQ